MDFSDPVLSNNFSANFFKDISFAGKFYTYMQCILHHIVFDIVAPFCLLGSTELINIYLCVDVLLQVRKASFLSSVSGTGHSLQLRWKPCT